MKAILSSVLVVAFATGAAFVHQKDAEATAFLKTVQALRKFEIQASRLAMDRAQSPAVKTLAQRMIDDHEMLGQQLELTGLDAHVSAPQPNGPLPKHDFFLAKLMQANGGAFDRAFIGTQLHVYREAVTAIRSYSENGRTTALKEFAKKAHPTLQQHLSIAKSLDLTSLR